MKFEIELDMEAIGEDDTILVKDELGEYPDREYIPRRTCKLNGSGYHQSYEIKVWWYSLTCGHKLYLMENDGDAYLYGNGDTYPYGKFCPVCGARVTHKER